MALVDVGPYRGQQSYQTEDAEFFYGRDRDGEQLTARILSTRMTVLYAASGAGKTSLLNARVIPGLESQGWIPVYARPNENPMASIRLATISALLPPLETEAFALARTMTELGCTPDSTLSELLAKYDAADAPLRRRLITPVQTGTDSDAEVPTAEWPEMGAVVPYFARLLRRSIEFPTLWNHLNAIALARTNLLRGVPAGVVPPMESAVTLRQLAERFEDPALRVSYRMLLSDAEVPLSNLRPFFENLIEIYGNRLPGFGLVLIVDQFEELFTLFVDRSHTATEDLVGYRDWRLRPRLMKELEALYTPPAHSGACDLPVRFVISLREEYIAHLDPIRLFAPEINDTAYRVGLLQAEDARVAIQRPIELYRHAYPPGTVDHIVGELGIEDGRFVAPSQLQIVCEKLWRVGSANATGNKTVIQVPEGESWVQHMLESFLEESLSSIARESVGRQTITDPAIRQRAILATRHEMLDILSLLITPTHRRNIVEEPQLVEVPFRRAEWRRELLGALHDRKLVRRERRLDSTFYEVTHEFLIKSIEEAVRKALHDDTEGSYGRLSIALTNLRNLLTGGASSLTPESYKALDANRDRLDFDGWATAMMFRSSVIHGDWKRMAGWARAYAAGNGNAQFDELLARLRHEQALLLDDVWILHSERERIGPDCVELMLKQFICSSHGDAREAIQYWTGRLANGHA